MRERILRGDIPLGQAISRRRVAAELGMSFLPVTEAMQRLELEGLVESRPRSGTRVCLPSRERVRDHHIVRAALESHAALHFCRVATAAERRALRELGESVDARCARDDVRAYVTLHRALHTAIATGAHCRPLAAAIDRATALPLACASAATEGSPRWWRVEHAVLADTVAGGDPAAARQAMWNHLHRELEDTLRLLEPWFGRRAAARATPAA